MRGQRRYITSTSTAPAQYHNDRTALSCVRPGAVVVQYHCRTSRNTSMVLAVAGVTWGTWFLGLLWVADLRARVSRAAQASDAAREPPHLAEPRGEGRSGYAPQSGPLERRDIWGARFLQWGGGRALRVWFGKRGVARRPQPPPPATGRWSIPERSSARRLASRALSCLRCLFGLMF